MVSAIDVDGMVSAIDVVANENPSLKETKQLILVLTSRFTHKTAPSLVTSVKVSTPLVYNFPMIPIFPTPHS